MTKEEILDKYEGNSIWGDLEKWRGDVYYKDDVLKIMEEYGKQQYNKGIEDAVDCAKIKYVAQVFLYDEEPVVNTEEILKLKI